MAENAVTAARQIPARGTSPATVNVLGVRVSTLSLADSANLVTQWAREDGAGRYVCATSVHGIIEAHFDSTFRDTLNSAALVTPDGMPLVWVGRLEGARQMERVYGPDLMLGVCQRSASSGGPRHYFYGGAPGIPELLATRLGERFPGLEVAGTCSPPYRELSRAELTRIVDQINASRPDIVWVGLSTPKQERWIRCVRGCLNAAVVVSVGAAFDFHTGRLRQAPSWLQRLGLEWLFRLVMEPRRLWRRYLRNNPLFVMLAVAQLLRLRSPGSSTS